MLIRSLLLLVACLVTAQLLVALPLEHDEPETLLSQESEQLPLEAGGEGPAVVRDKRTIGFLRQAFPTLSQIIDRKIQAITRLIFRLVGRLVLRGGGGGGGGGTDSSDEDNERRVQITLPTFPPSADDEDEDEDDEESTGSADDSTTTTTEPSEVENALAESQLNVRKARQAPAAAPAAAEDEEYEDEDQAAAATGDNEVAGSSEDTEAEDTDSAESEASEDDPRNKRFLNLGGSGGSGGGSGNFLFDIIRLVAGSGTTQGQDEADNAPLDENSTHSGKADDGYSAGVPGPLTRLFVIANRGIANLIQDLILRLAQTSERIVNFKARLITSII